jgi:exodeoxyribonuclease V beta subunit
VAERFDYAKAPLDAHAVIEAGAGTGKTYSIIQLFLRLVIEKRIPPEAILVVTFTEAATAELRARIRTALTRCIRETKGEDTGLSEEDPYCASLLQPACSDAPQIRALLESASASFDEMSVFTIHGFCKRILRDHAFEYGALFTSTLIDDINPLVHEIALDYYRRRFYTAGAFELEWAAANRITVGELESLVHQTLSRVDLEILPEKSAGQNIDQIRKDLGKIHDRMRRAWKESGDRYYALIISQIGKMNKRSHNKITRLKSAADTYFDLNYSLLFDDDIRCGSSAYLESTALKGQDIGILLSDPLAVEFDTFIEKYHECIKKLDDAAAHLRADFLRYARVELANRKRRRNLWSFDDLIVQVRDGLQSPRGDRIAASLRRRYHAALIDEFQDTDPAQCLIFEKIFNHPSTALFYIGDPKQAIYSFRGADVYAYLEAKKGKQVYVKDENWRSNQALVEGVNRVFAGDDPFMMNGLIEYHEARAAAGMKLVVAGDSHAPLVLWRTEEIPVDTSVARRMLWNGIASEIGRLLYKSSRSEAHLSATDGKVRPLRPVDIAVIVRRNADAASLREVLRRAGIPSVVAENRSIFESVIFDQLNMVLSAVHARRETYIRAALGSDLFGMTAHDIDSMSHNEQKWELILDSFRRIHDAWERRGFMGMIMELYGRFPVRQTLVSRPDGLRKIADLDHLVELYHRGSIENGLGPSELLAWSVGRSREKSGADEHELRLETDEEAVNIVTVHRSKGLEFPVVFVACGWEPFDSKKRPRWFYHDRHRMICDLVHGNDKDSELYHQAGSELAAEQLRLLYVALTRGSCKTYLAGFVSAGYQRSATGYLFHRHRVKMEGETAQRLSCVEALIADMIKKKQFDELTADIERYAVKDVIRIEPVPVPASAEFDIADAPAPLDALCRKAERRIEDDWKISSFSYIAASRTDFHGEEYDDDAVIPGELSGSLIPKGTAVGSCIHEIFENADFSDCNSDKTKAATRVTLEKYALNTEPVAQWADALLESTLAKKIPLLGASLSQIGNAKCLAEMEFYLAVKRIDDQLLRKTIFSNIDPAFNNGDLKNLSSLTFDSFAGFLRGFIDLVIEHNGKYYLADWKSNYLGPDVSFYSQEKLCRAMDEHLYLVQGIIYSLALHQHLAARIPGYSFEKHFGGVIYLFVRGINPDGDEGVWSFAPPYALIEQLSAIIVRSSDHEK